MFTEDEAHTKDCRIAGMVAGRSKLEAHFPKCIASGCMGWVATQLPIAATVSLVTGHQITEPQPGKGCCGYARRG